MSHTAILGLVQTAEIATLTALTMFIERLSSPKSYSNML
jgi:hypothetical protein